MPAGSAIQRMAAAYPARTVDPPPLCSSGQGFRPDPLVSSARGSPSVRVGRMRVVVVGGTRHGVPNGQRRLLGGGELVPFDHRVPDQFFLLVCQVTLVDHRNGGVGARSVRPLFGETLIEGLARQLLIDGRPPPTQPRRRDRPA